MRTPSRSSCVLVLLALPTFLVACARATGGGSSNAEPPMPSLAGFGPEVEQGLVRLREATAPYRDFSRAVVAGYAPDVPPCVAHPEHGAMGFHHSNRAYVDRQLEVTRPEILTYERDAGGRYVLTGAEYIIPYSLWPADSTPPSLFGQPLQQAPNLRLWYLHVWIWKENPVGLFAPWNPRVHCPAG